MISDIQKRSCQQQWHPEEKIISGHLYADVAECIGYCQTGTENLNCECGKFLLGIFLPFFCFSRRKILKIMSAEQMPRGFLHCAYIRHLRKVQGGVTPEDVIDRADINMVFISFEFSI